jgi:hypothetical protein
MEVTMINRIGIRRALCVAAAAAAVGLTAVGAASAQVNCNVLPHGPQRASCYGREAQIYRQQALQYNAIARQQYQSHALVGAALARTPLIGRYAAPAWNVPRTIYGLRYGRP